jgi:hypothetical protein
MYEKHHTILERVGGYEETIQFYLNFGRIVQITPI